MESGTVSAWLVEEGKAVKKGQALLEIETDKVTMEVEAQVDGVLRKILVEAGKEVPVSEVVGVVAAADENIEKYLMVISAQAETPISAIAPPAEGVAAPVLEQRVQTPVATIDAGASVDVISRVGQEPSQIIGASPVEIGAEGEIILSRAEKVAAERLTSSYQHIPHIHISMDVSAVWLQQFRQGYKLEGKKISFNDLIVKATARALGEFPRVNSFEQGGAFHYASQVNVGVAVASEKGLVVPVIRGAGDKTVEEIAMEGVRLVDAARHGRLSPDDMMGGTFTISNLGMFGVSRFTAIINPPQVAILAVGAIENKVVAAGADAFAVRPQLTMTLAADHRVVDGALAARFLARLKEILETPGLLG